MTLPTIEELNAQLTAENERLRAGMRVLAELCGDLTDECPLSTRGCQSDCVCGRLPVQEAIVQPVTCWCKWAMEEVEARKQVVPSDRR